MKRLLGQMGERAVEAVFPSNIYCISCGSLIDGSRRYSLCDSCIRKLHWINGRACAKCGKALPDTYRGSRCYDCMGQAHHFTRGFSCLTYGLYERDILMELKYNGKGYLAKKMGDILCDRIACEDIRPDVIVPVPTGRKREKERGYNQSALMAERLAYRQGIPADSRLLIRRKETRPLRSMNPAERQMELKDAFQVPQGKEEAVRGRTILLIDDIYTTGATADACSSAFLQAGAREVYLLTLASGGNRKPDGEG